jgi:hypothetical protein
MVMSLQVSAGHRFIQYVIEFQTSISLMLPLYEVGDSELGSLHFPTLGLGKIVQSEYSELNVEQEFILSLVKM